MLINSISAEFSHTPVAFVASFVTIIAFVVGTLATLLRRRKPATDGSALSPHLFRLVAALMWSLGLALGSGVLAGKVFGIHWLAGSLTAIIAAFVITIAIAAVAGHLAKPWISQVATVRRQDGQHQECFVGTTTLDEFNNLCTTGITWLVILALAVCLAEPWWAALEALDRIYPDQGAGVAAGMASFASFALAIAFGRQFMRQAATTAFTAQAGISWADTTAVSAQPTRSTKRNSPPPKRRKRTARNPDARREAGS